MQTNNSTSNFQNIMVWNHNNTGETAVAPKPQAENIMVWHGGQKQTSTDSRASMRKAESGLGASLLASKIKGSAKVSDPDDPHGGAGGPFGGGGTPHLVNNGGKVIQSPSLAPVYYGDYWNTTAGKADSSHNDAFAKYWVGSSNEAILNEYGVNKGSYAGSDTLSAATP